MTKDQIVWNMIFTFFYAVSLSFSGVVLFQSGRIPSSISAMDLIIVSLAVFRLIRLFVYDSVTSYIRDYLGKLDAGPGKTLSDLLSCPWCTGVWTALLVSFFYFLSPLAWFPIFVFALAGAGAYLQIIINKIGRHS